MQNSAQFQQLLSKATEFHGHLCNGQVIGVRLAMAGLDMVGISDPYGCDRKKLVVFVEVARCAADAIMIVSGCRVGKRSFRLVDTGRMAATFYHMLTGEAFRVSLQPDLYDRIAELGPDLDMSATERLAFSEWADDELFAVRRVTVNLASEDTPGFPASTVPCDICGERIFDKREIQDGSGTICRSCSPGAHLPFSYEEVSLSHN